MLPNNFRYYCEGAPSVAAAFLAEFGGDAGCDTDNPCTCGTDAAAGLVIQRPEFSVSSAIWWMTNGAAALMHGTCPDVRGASDEGLGASPPRACFVVLCGALWRLVWCLAARPWCSAHCADRRVLLHGCAYPQAPPTASQQTGSRRDSIWYPTASSALPLTQASGSASRTTTTRCRCWVRTHRHLYLCPARPTPLPAFQCRHPR